MEFFVITALVARSRRACPSVAKGLGGAYPLVLFRGIQPRDDPNFLYGDPEFRKTRLVRISIPRKVTAWTASNATAPPRKVGAVSLRLGDLPLPWYQKLTWTIVAVRLDLRIQPELALRQPKHRPPNKAIHRDYHQRHDDRGQQQNRKLAVIAGRADLRA